MRKTPLAVLLALLITAATGAGLVNFGKANPYGEFQHISISNPQDGQIYQNTTIPLLIYVYIPKWNPGITSIYYSIDGKSYNTIANDFPENQEYISASDKLVNLAEGSHTLKAYADTLDGKVLSTGCTFTVNTTFQCPEVTILSPLNQRTYTTNEVPLIYNIDCQVKYATYTLDNNSAVNARVEGFVGNTTLSGLSEGQHTIYLSVLTELNIYTQETANFTVLSNPKSGPESFPVSSFPTVPVVAVSAVSIAAITAASLILALRKRRKEAQQT